MGASSLTSSYVRRSPLDCAGVKKGIGVEDRDPTDRRYQRSRRRRVPAGRLRLLRTWVRPCGRIQRCACEQSRSGHEHTPVRGARLRGRRRCRVQITRPAPRLRPRPDRRRPACVRARLPDRGARAGAGTPGRRPRTAGDRNTPPPPALAEALAGSAGQPALPPPRPRSLPPASSSPSPGEWPPALPRTASRTCPDRRSEGAVGYSVRGDRRTSRSTRVEFATTGVVLRRLLNDPELSGVDAVSCWTRCTNGASKSTWRSRWCANSSTCATISPSSSCPRRWTPTTGRPPRGSGRCSAARHRPGPAGCRAGASPHRAVGASAPRAGPPAVCGRISSRTLPRPSSTPSRTTRAMCSSSQPTSRGRPDRRAGPLPAQ